MPRFRALGSALLALALFPAGAAAQADGSPEEGGWIGIQVEGRSLPDGATRVMIVGVEHGSPARQAGVRPFDILVRLDGEEVSPEVLLELGERLRPGLPLRLTVLRGNRVRTLRVIAGARPEPMDPATMEELTARVDSARLQLLNMMDSLLADTTWARVRADMEATRRALAERAEATGQMEAVTEMMERARAVMGRAREAMRSRRYGRPWPPAGPPPARVRITVGEAGADERRGPEGRPGRGRITIGRGGPGDGRGPGRPPPGVRFRSPYLLGEHFVAGAELEEMEPAAPVDARAGGGRLLVVQVLEGSPADRAGLAPEDVILTIGGAPVGSLREFRIRLGRVILRGRPEMQIVRGDSTLVVTLPRP